MRANGAMLKACQRRGCRVSAGMRFAGYILGIGLLLGCLQMDGPVTLGGGDRVTEPPVRVRQALALNSFYTKHADVDGFSVVASDNVSDYALLEAAYLIRKMVGHRKDILQAMARNKVRFAIMAHNEYTTHIPEHRDLQPRLYWNRRARGLGATPERPAVSCGEENLLGYINDPYASENILIHEFAHAIHLMGLSETDPTFDERLEAAYTAAVREGLWKGKYAGRNHHEYFAEGVQSWFDTNRENDFEHNHVDTREELQQYDPRLAKLVREVFGSGPWRYRHPQHRQPHSAHLAGFDRAKAPVFGWAEKSVAWYDRFKEGLETLAPGNAVDIDLQSPEDRVYRSPASAEETFLYISNASQQAIRLEWMDGAGRALPRGSELRPTDHSEQQTYAGHIWRIVDDESGKPLHYFVAPKAPGKLIYRAAQ